VLRALPISSLLTEYSNRNYILRNVQVMKLVIMQFSPTSRHFIPLRSRHSPQHTVLKYFSIYSSLNIRDQVSHPYRPTGKIIVFIFLDRKREDKGF
jgi:hypothetical protein